MVRCSIGVVSGAAIVSGASGYLVLFIAARWLGPGGYAEFGVFWALLYTVVGFLFGIQQETARSVRTGAILPSQSRGPSAFAVALVAGGAVGVVFVLLSVAGGFAALGPLPPLTPWLLAFAAVLASGQFVLTGALGGRDAWGLFGAVVMVEAVTRLLLFLVAALIAPTVSSMAIAAVAGFAAWGGIIASRAEARASLTVRADSRWPIALSRVGQAMLASGGAGVLTNGFPVILAAAASTNGGVDPSDLGVLILLVTLTRAPLMVPLVALSSVLVTWFVDRRARLRSALGVPLALVAGASVAFALLAALVAPAVMPLVFGAAYVTTALEAGVLTFTAGGLGVLTVTGAAALAAERHGWYLAGWVVAIVVVVSLLFFLPIPLSSRVAISLGIGPLIGALVHWCAVPRGLR